MSVLGMAEVGKTSLLNTLAGKKFNRKVLFRFCSLFLASSCFSCCLFLGRTQAQQR